MKSINTGSSLIFLFMSLLLMGLPVDSVSEGAPEIQGMEMDVILPETRIPLNRYGPTEYKGGSIYCRLVCMIGCYSTESSISIYTVDGRQVHLSEGIIVPGICLYKALPIAVTIEWAFLAGILALLGVVVSSDKIRRAASIAGKFTLVLLVLSIILSFAIPCEPDLKPGMTAHLIIRRAHVSSGEMVVIEGVLLGPQAEAAYILLKLIVYSAALTLLFMIILFPVFLLARPFRPRKRE